MATVVLAIGDNMPEWPSAACTIKDTLLNSRKWEKQDKKKYALTVTMLWYVYAQLWLLMVAARKSQAPKSRRRKKPPVLCGNTKTHSRMKHNSPIAAKSQIDKHVSIHPKSDRIVRHDWLVLCALLLQSTLCSQRRRLIGWIFVTNPAH